jgi:hypothetical protein
MSKDTNHLLNEKSNIFIYEKDVNDQRIACISPGLRLIRANEI